MGGKMKHQTPIFFNAVLMFVLLIGMTVYAGPPSQDATYVGSTTCKTCHSSIYNRWAETMHPKKIVPAAEAEFINDADGNGTDDFQDGLTLDGSHVFDSKWKEFGDIGYPPILGLAETGQDGLVRVMTIGDRTYTIDFTLGGAGWKQRYVTTIGNSFYILPVQYNKKTGEYVTYHPGNWYVEEDGAFTGSLYGLEDIPVSMGRTGDSWQKRCMGCHTTGLTKVEQNEDGEWLGQVGDNFAEYGIGCEACHGSGSEHAAGAFGDEDKKIVNPDDIDDPQTKLSVCGRCHSRGKSTGGTFGYPWDETNDLPCLPGDDVDDFYSDGGGKWPDGSSVKHHQQYLDFKLSTHFNEKGMTCISCHDSHDTDFEHDILMDNDDNGLCLSCHANDGFEDEDAIRAHTHHDYDPEGSGESRCTKCHMPKIAKSAIHYDIHAHTFEAILPEKTLKLNMPNSCMASCHKSEEIDGVTYTNEDISDWDSDADVTIARYLDGFAERWWGSKLPTASIATSSPIYSQGETVMLNVGAANPNHRFVDSQIIIVALIPKMELQFFPAWGTEWASISAKLPNDFLLPSTPLVPYVPNGGSGTYFVGIAILSPDSNLEKLIFYSDFSFDSGGISMFTLQ